MFDLDETLVHCIFNDKDIHDADVFLDIKMPNGKSANTGFNIRPYWQELMDSIYDDWEIVVFTASCKNYADTILDYLDPENKYFPHRFYRETCWKTPEGVYIKDLRVFHQWNIDDIILVDNAVYSFGFQLDNGIPIFPYIQGKDDKQLFYLKEYLNLIANKDIIKDLKKTFKMSELYECDIESFLDYYEDDDGSDENANDILDKMDFVGVFRSKAMSFQHSSFVARNRLSTETPSVITDNAESKHSDPTGIVTEKTSQTPNMGPVNSFVDPEYFEHEQHTPPQAKPAEFSAMKPKLKSKKIKYAKLKKVQSVDTELVCHNTLFASRETSNPFVAADGDADNGSIKHSTPKGRKSGKRFKKKRKCRNSKPMKELKLGVSAADALSEVNDEGEQVQRISLFGKSNSKDNMYESSDDSCPEDHRTPILAALSVGGLTQEFRNDTCLAKSAKLRGKRNSSPLGHGYLTQESKNDFINYKVKRKVSTSSNSDSDGDFEREDAQIISTT